MHDKSTLKGLSGTPNLWLLFRIGHQYQIGEGVAVELRRGGVVPWHRYIL